MTPILPSTISARERPERSVRGLQHAFATVVVVIIGIVYAAGSLYDRSVRRAAGETMQATATLQSKLLRGHVLERVRDARLLAVRPTVWSSVDPDSAGTDA
ncbi:MAG: hypothetical protein Q8K55_11570, partial [Gemmatimonadaceae bacterium]|nr:hypothetical protein [Gemmatimonadaceae bacterium]